MAMVLLIATKGWAGFSVLVGRLDIFILLILLGKEGGWEGGRELARAHGREGGREGGSERERVGGREGVSENVWEGGREQARE